MNNLSQGFQLPLGIKFPRQQCRRGHLWKTPFNNKIYENEISTSIFFFHSSLDFLNFYINRGHEFLCFSLAGWLSIIICYESASLESILFLLDEKSKSLVVNSFCLNNFLPHAVK